MGRCSRCALQARRHGTQQPSRGLPTLVLRKRDRRHRGLESWKALPRGRSLASGAHLKVDVRKIEEDHLERPAVITVNDACAGVDGVFPCEPRARRNAAVAAGGDGDAQVGADHVLAARRDHAVLGAAGAQTAVVFSWGGAQGLYTVQRTVACRKCRDNTLF